MEWAECLLLAAPWGQPIEEEQGLDGFSPNTRLVNLAMHEASATCIAPAEATGVGDVSVSARDL